MNELQGAGAPGRRPRWKAMLFSGLLLIFGLGVIELASYGLLWRAKGARPRLGPPERGSESRPAAGGETRAPISPAAWTDQVLHPFLGFVQKEEGSISPYLRVDEQGFHTFPEAPPPRDERYEVAIFGGSVALLFAADAREVLAEELGRLPAAAGKRVWVTPYALGGYKQPQMLMTLTYLLSIDRAPDLVLLLDGFNDVVLPAAENRMASVNPYWPRGWAARVGNLVDPAEQKQLAQLAALEEELGRARSSCRRGIGAWSPTCRLLRHSRERRLEGRIGELRTQLTLSRRGGDRRSFLRQGPPYDLSRVDTVLRDSAALWSRSSLLMHRLCAANGIPFFHFLQPNQYVAGSKIIGPREAKTAIGEPARELYRRPAELGYPYLIAEGRKLAAAGEPFHDLTMVFAGVSDPLYIDTCCHFGAPGSRLLGKEISSIVLAGLAPRSPPGGRPVKGASR